MHQHIEKIQFIDLDDASVWQQLKHTHPNIVIITDANVKALYADKLAQQHNFNLISIAAGEPHKSRQSKALIEDQLFKLNIQRNDLLIAVGGGVITDLTGFIAATYMRGIEYINIPTTFLGMVDAAIGGKTAINTDYAKNCIGVFNHAQQTLIDTNFLQTLAPHSMRDGLVETIKHGLIADADLFFTCEQHMQDIVNHNYKNITALIQTSMQIKLNIVAKDQTDNHMRKLLNLGHTVAHSLEQSSNYAISHGAAVAIGIIIETNIAVKLNILSSSTQQCIAKCLRPLCEKEINSITPNIPTLLELMHKDKKNINNAIHCVMLSDIGKCYCKHNQFTVAITNDIMAASLAEVLTQEINAC